jgi:N-acetylmuramoyl-L-alanine amidase
MTPRYITIHATENFSAAGNARAHANLLLKGSLKAPHNSLGYIIWHFTIDDHSIHQSLPCNEQGQHADYDGEGNRSSIGIEMCENAGNSRKVTLDRTAKLTALLMKQYGIPISNIVPHQHWRMIRFDDKRDLGHKTCPHFLVKGGESDPAWQAFLGEISRYRSQL